MLTGVKSQWTLNLLSSETYPLARCLDGTQGGYYISPGSGADAEKVARAWRLNAPFTAFLHLLSVVAIGGYAIYLAVNPYWPELQDWVQEVIKIS
jgi:hypothetical protein